MTKLKEITTDNGFTWKIDPWVADDYELIDAIQKIMLGRPTTRIMSDIVTDILGEKGKEALYEFCKDEKTKRVSASKVMVEVDNIFKQAVEILKKA